MALHWNGLDPWITARSSVPGMMVVLVFLMGLPVTGLAQPPSSPLEKFRQLEFAPTEANFDKGWEDRVAVEFEIVNGARLDDLRSSLSDTNPFVRAMAARVLGIRGDAASGPSLAELVKTDPEYMVRVRAVEALGLLKTKREVIELAKTDQDLAVRWSATLAARQLDSDIDYGALVRQAYARGITRAAMGVARVGKPAPDFSAHTSEGKPFRLSSVLGKKPIAIYFAAFDG